MLVAPIISFVKHQKKKHLLDNKPPIARAKMKSRAKRRLWPDWAPLDLPALFVRQDIPTGIPSDIQTGGADAILPDPTPADDEPKTQTRIVTVTKTNSGDHVETDIATTVPSGSTESNDDSANSGGLSGGAIAGIVVGVLAFLFILAGLLLWRRWKQKKALAKSLGAEDSAQVVSQLDSWPVAEVDGLGAVKERSELPAAPLASAPEEESARGRE